MTELAERLAEVRGSVKDAAAEAARDPGEITMIVVTKFHPADLVRELHDLGVRDFGESRHQEARPKVESLAEISATWHFVGQLQSKKARQVASYVDMIHSLDRSSLVKALDGTQVEVFIEVNLTDDPSRGGASPDAVLELAAQVAELPGLRLRGLMGVAPRDGQARPAFALLRRSSEQLQVVMPDASDLSMGMSGDYREAILEGATHLRIGAAITGNRPTAG